MPYLVEYHKRLRRPPNLTQLELESVRSLEEILTTNPEAGQFHLVDTRNRVWRAIWGAGIYLAYIIQRHRNRIVVGKIGRWEGQEPEAE